MANRDGTGPRGQGPRTGRGLGICNLLDDSDSLGGFGRGIRRRGRRNGRGNF